jgi:cytoskeletal protein CcmA (bactofilin family)
MPASLDAQTSRAYHHVQALVDPGLLMVVVTLVMRHPGHDRDMRGEGPVFQKLDGSIRTALGGEDPSGRPATSAAPAPVAPATPSPGDPAVPPVAPGAPLGLDPWQRAPVALSAGRHLETVIGTGTHLEGRLTTEGTIRIRGSVQGELASSETIIIEEPGRVTATITAAQVVVAGQMEGQVRGRGRVELRPTARMRGELHAGVLVIQEGAAFEGRASMTDLVTEPDRWEARVEPVSTEHAAALPLQACPPGQEPLLSMNADRESPEGPG